MILKKIIEELSRTNDPNYYSTPIDYIELFDVFKAYRESRWPHNLSYMYEYNIKFIDLNFVYYFNYINYVSDDYTSYRKNYVNILRILLLYKVIFVKNIPLYRNIILNISGYIQTLFNILLFNIKWALTALIISFVYFFVSLFYIQVDISRQLAIWYIFAIVYYLLMSTFNSFLIKYKYGKFTSAIQRFWKRTGMVFWLIEGFLFLLFFYYFLNSSQEPLYMFDYSSLNQELLLQLKTTFKNLLLLSLAIYLSFILILNLNYLTYFQNLIILLFILLIVFYSLYIESYQFIYIIGLYADKFWLFEDISQSWVLEIEQNTLRVKQQYFVYCLVAKYWHFIFIFISWFFFFIKSIEIKKISYTMLGYNTQNLLILYVLNILCLIQWIKYVWKKFLEITYYWFHIQYDEKLLNNLFFEIYNTTLSLFNVNEIIFYINRLLIISVNLLYSDNMDLWKFL